MCDRAVCDGQILIEYSIDDMIDREDFHDKLHVEMNGRIIKSRRNIVNLWWKNRPICRYSARR